jgi:hypothetical protein
MRDAPLYIQLLRYWFGYVPNLVNSVDILAVRHVKQGIEAERFRAVQPLVQETYITLHSGLLPESGNFDTTVNLNVYGMFHFHLNLLSSTYIPAFLHILPFTLHNIS